MTDIGERLRNILTELTIIKEALSRSGDYPPCCLKFHADGRISCGLIGPLPKEEFMRRCRECRIRTKRILKNLEDLKILEKIKGFGEANS